MTKTRYYSVIIVLVTLLLTTSKSYSQTNDATSKELKALLDSANMTFRSSPANAVLLLDEIQAKALAANNLSVYARAEITRGTIAYYKGNHEEASGYLHNALKTAEKINDHYNISLACNELGTLYKKHKEREEALSYYTRAMEEARLSNDEPMISNVFNNLGLIYEENGQYEEALEHFQKSLEISRKLKSELGEGYSLAYIGNLKRLMKEFDEGETYLLESLSLRRKLHDDFAVAVNLIYLASLFKDKGDFNKAIAYAHEANTFSKKINYPDMQRYSYQLLSEANEKKGDFRSAYQYHKQYLAFQDSLFNVQKNKQIYELKTEYETEKKEQQITLLSQENTIQQLNLQQRNILLIIAGLLLILLTFGGIVYYRNRKQKEARLLQEAELKEELVRVQAQNELHQDRLRISRELHDNIGSHLTFINSAVSHLPEDSRQRDEKIKQVKDLTSSTIRELRKTVWLINKPAVNAEEFAMKLREYFKNQFPVQVIFEATTSIELTTPVVTQMFRVIQEAVNNAIKHAQAEKITITIKKEMHGQLNLTVEDNGVGFSTLEVSVGYGLANIKSRMESIHGSFSIVSHPGRGTTLTFSLPYS